MLQKRRWRRRRRQRCRGGGTGGGTAPSLKAIYQQQQQQRRQVEAEKGEQLDGEKESNHISAKVTTENAAAEEAAAELCRLITQQLSALGEVAFVRS